MCDIKKYIILTPFLVALLALGTALGECPWPQGNPELSALNAACLCALNLKNEYSVQCSSVPFPLLMRTLHVKAKDVNFDLLYVNNSDVGVLSDRTFFGLRIRNLQLSYCDISNITDGAFEGVENVLENLNLQDNLLREVLTKSLVLLKHLSLLDLSGNKIMRIPDRSFRGFKLNTLKLSGNDITLMPEAFTGLEDSLKNLNMKGCHLKQVPLAIKHLKSLAFLDLAQNSIRQLEPGVFEPLHSLTALNLERNLLQDLHPETFKGVSDTLSSLSLLNNLLTKFPTEAINSLPHLRVLDIGFNLVTKLPDDSFHSINSLTLLAIDGNPLPTVPQKAFVHLNGTLRGLSLGGHYFSCDCKIAWILEWIENFDLQVTSRDRDPQYCGHPPTLKTRSFYQLDISDLLCKETAPPSPTNPAMVPVGGKEIVQPEEKEVTERPKEKKFGEKILPKENPNTAPVEEVDDLQEQTKPLPVQEDRRVPAVNASTYKPPLRVSQPTPSAAKDLSSKKEESEPPDEEKEASGKWRDSNNGKRVENNMRRIEEEKRNERNEEERNYLLNREQISEMRHPSLVRRPPERPKSPQDFYSPSSKENLYGEEVIVQDAYWDSNSINIQWDSEISNILGFRVVYRLFGDKYFKMGQPLAPTAREFKIKNVPSNEYFVACVVSLEEMDIKLESVPFGQCREIRTGDADGKLSTHMDKIIIAASASICGTVIIAVIIFICCYRGKTKPENEKEGVPAVLNSSSPPLASLGALGTSKVDWDTISMYSQRSIPRARMYHHMDRTDDARSHVSQISSKSRTRSLADGQSQRSFSGMSGVHLPNQHFVSPLSLSRPELCLSRQSLAHSQFSSGYPHFASGGIISRAASQRTDRRRSTRSKSRERSNSRLSHAGSSHSLTGYDTDGWTDHDMDIYMARNPTRGGLVQL